MTGCRWVTGVNCEVTGNSGQKTDDNMNTSGERCWVDGRQRERENFHWLFTNM